MREEEEDAKSNLIVSSAALHLHDLLPLPPSTVTLSCRGDFVAALASEEPLALLLLFLRELLY